MKYSENREKWPSNEKLYQLAKQTPWSEKKVENRRLSFFGHICRLPEDTPAKIALNEALKPVKRPRGKQKNTYLETIDKQLKKRNIKSIKEAITIAQDTWNTIIQGSSL